MLIVSAQQLDYAEDMKKLSHNQAGFGVIEVLLIFIALMLAGFIGYYVAHNQNTKQVPPFIVTNTKQSTTTQTPQLSDKDLIIAAVKAYKGAGDQSNATVTVDDIVGSNARGRFTNGEDGAAFIAHKENGTWQVVFEGQQGAGSDIGQKYNLPSGWYVTN